MNAVLLLVLLVLAVVGLATLVVVLVRAFAREKRAPDVWPAVAERLGLEGVDTPDGDGSLAGRCMGLEVEVTLETRGKKARLLRAKTALVPPLDLGLTLGSEPALREPVPEGASPFATGNPAIDRRLEPRARDARGARRLFERKALRDLLEAALGRWSQVAISDGAIALGGERPILEPFPIDDLLRDAAAVARLIDEERPRIGRAS